MRGFLPLPIVSMRWFPTGRIEQGCRLNEFYKFWRKVPENNSIRACSAFLNRFWNRTLRGRNAGRSPRLR